MFPFNPLSSFPAAKNKKKVQNHDKDTPTTSKDDELGELGPGQKDMPKDESLKLLYVPLLNLMWLGMTAIYAPLFLGRREHKAELAKLAKTALCQHMHAKSRSRRILPHWE
ncbi:hypothetical protein ACLKA6_009482 [Drosophila palustris]